MNFLLYRTMETRPSDIFVVSFPKAGTTWTQEITYLIKTELDFEKSRKQKLDVRFPFLEFYCSETVSLLTRSPYILNYDAQFIYRTYRKPFE